MNNKNYLKELAKSLFFELSDEQIEKLSVEMDEIQEMIDQAKKTVDDKVEPSNYPRVVNCSSLRKDVPVVNEKKKDYLSNAKVADKYVVGR